MQLCGSLSVVGCVGGWRCGWWCEWLCVEVDVRRVDFLWNWLCLVHFVCVWLYTELVACGVVCAQQ